MPVSTTLIIVVSVSLLVALIVAAGWHIWYALGLARVFAQHDTEPWRAWVPVLNEAELLRLGRQDPVKAALFLVPIVGVYALVLKAMAAHRLNTAAGRGGGATVLAVLVPPVWAMIAAQPRPAASSTALAAPVAPPAPAPRPAPGVAVAAAPGAAPAAPGVAMPAPPAALPAPAAPAALPASALPAPAPASPPSVAPPGPRRSPVAEPVAVSGLEEPAPLTRRALRDADDATAIVRAPAGWELVLPSGESVPIAARSIVLGRNPTADDAGVQYQAVSDDGRTVSKNHARLDWNGQAWSVTDLGSTNGVAVVDAAGIEQALPAEGTASVIERFILGDAAILLRRAAG
jgi:hypothetical protein